jgi:hypothetical protein
MDRQEQETTCPKLSGAVQLDHDNNQTPDEAPSFCLCKIKWLTCRQPDANEDLLTGLETLS